MAAGDVIFFVIDGMISRVEQLDEAGQVFACGPVTEKKARQEIAAVASRFHRSAT